MGELQEEFNLSELNTAYLERLFSIFDLDGNGVVDCDEILSGIALLCKGTVEEKLELCFQVSLGVTYSIGVGAISHYIR